MRKFTLLKTTMNLVILSNNTALNDFFGQCAEDDQRVSAERFRIQSYNYFEGLLLCYTIEISIEAATITENG